MNDATIGVVRLVGDPPSDPANPSVSDRISNVAAAWAKPVALVITLLYLLATVGLLWIFGFGGAGLPSAFVSAANWEHSLTLFNAISAIGYAAVGALLGVQVKQVKIVEAKAEGKQVAAQANAQAKAGEQLLRLLSKGRTSGGAAFSVDQVNELQEAEDSLRQEILVTKGLAQRVLAR